MFRFEVLGFRLEWCAKVSHLLLVILSLPRLTTFGSVEQLADADACVGPPLTSKLFLRINWGWCRYMCDTCKAHTSASRITRLECAPEILICHLKRFRHDGLMGQVGWFVRDL